MELKTMPMPSQGGVQETFALFSVPEEKRGIPNPKTTTTNHALIGVSTDATAKMLLTTPKTIV